MKRYWLGVCLCFSLAACAADDTAINEPKSQSYEKASTHPAYFEYLPDDLSRFESAMAHDSNKHGVGTVSCTLMLDHHLTNCQVVSESPPGWGFGQSALLISKWVKMHPETKDGIDVSGAVTIPFRF